MYPNQDTAISVFKNPRGTQKQKNFLKIGKFSCVEKKIKGYVLFRLNQMKQFQTSHHFLEK